MKTLNHAFGALLLTVSTSVVFSQVAPASVVPATPPPDPGERVLLDPFVVSEDDNVGYSANSTLAGTRINTALRDVGASISIITPEFLNDTASTNIGELLSLGALKDEFEGLI